MAEQFIRQKQDVDLRIQELKRRINRLSMLRMVSFIASFCTIVVGIVDNKMWAVLVGILFAVVFVVLVLRFYKIEESFHYQQALQEVLKRYIARFSDDWRSFADTGKEFLDDKETEYQEAAVDLDIFGEASLFQYMNVAVSKEGRCKLRDWLTEALGDCDGKGIDLQKSQKRQQAVRELQEKNQYCLRLEALSIKALAFHSKQFQEKFIVDKDEIHKEKRLAGCIGVGAFFCVLVTVVTLVLAVFQITDYRLFAGMLVFQLLCSQAMDGVLFAKSYGAFPYLRYLSAYKEFLQQLTKEEFSSEVLQHLKTEIQKDSQKGIARLNFIGEALNIRHNPIVYGVLCMLCFYNAFVYIGFVRWQAVFGERVTVWMQCVSEMEALLSLAVIGRTRQNVCYPHIKDSKEPYISMTSMCHPLIQEREVVGNDVLLRNQIRLITGSNMSGKTTYLRTLGVNMILAYAGAAVCASECEVSRMQLFTSMRVIDDVSHGISTFYAEVLRIKKMILFSKKQIPMLILIDEIFKGTNSADRIVGASGVIQELCVNWVNGMVSTHDFELCQLTEEQSMLTNYHFDEYFEDDQLKFEYRIKDGRCKTTNALHILKMAGISNQTL